MSNRIKGFVVTLKNDMKDEDAEHIRCAIALLFNVADVRPVESDLDDYIVENRLKTKLAAEIQKLIWET